MKQTKGSSGLLWVSTKEIPPPPPSKAALMKPTAVELGHAAKALPAVLIDIYRTLWLLDFVMLPDYTAIKLCGLHLIIFLALPQGCELPGVSSSLGSMAVWPV
jgi:hypothetical protein